MPSSLKKAVLSLLIKKPLLDHEQYSPLGDILRKYGLSFHQSDGTQVYATFTCHNSDGLAAIQDRMGRCLSDYNNWMTVDKFKLNTDKTELLVLHSRFRPDVAQTSLTIGNDTIYPSEHAQNISVIFDNARTLSKHVDALVKSAFYNVSNIAKTRQFLSFDTAKTLVVALVLSKTDNCNSLLCVAPKHLVAKLQNVQNAAADWENTITLLLF